MHWMQTALDLARQALWTGDVPIGAVVVRDGRLLGWGYNRREADNDPTAHAELLALRRAAQTLGGWRLDGCDLFVTLEPCPMCAGAAVQARIGRIFFGAYDPKGGCCTSIMRLTDQAAFSHRCQVYGGILESSCSQLLTQYFEGLRQGKSTGVISIR